MWQKNKDTLFCLLGSCVSVWLPRKETPNLHVLFYHSLLLFLSLFLSHLSSSLKSLFLTIFLALHNKLVIMPLPLLSPFGKLVQLLTIRFDFMLDLLWFLTRSKMEWRRRPIITHMRTGLELHWLLMDLCPKQNELKAFCGEWRKHKEGTRPEQGSHSHMAYHYRQDSTIPNRLHTYWPFFLPTTLWLTPMLVL